MRICSWWATTLHRWANWVIYNVDHLEAPVHMNLNEHEPEVERICVPGDGVKAFLVSKVHDKVVIHGMDCEYHMQSCKDTVGIRMLLHLTAFEGLEAVPTWGPQPNSVRNIFHGSLQRHSPRLFATPSLWESCSSINVFERGRFRKGWLGYGGIMVLG